MLRGRCRCDPFTVGKRATTAVASSGVISLDAATVLLQWATGGMLFCWFTTRRRIIGLGYGWLLRGVYLCFALGALAAPVVLELLATHAGLAAHHRDDECDQDRHGHERRGGIAHR